MLGQKRRVENIEAKERLPLPENDNAQSHTLVYNCIKYEKFFHYYTNCGILVESQGQVELRQRKNLSVKDNQHSPSQLIYKHSREPVLLDLCQETGFAVGVESKQECDIDLLIDDNGLRVAATETARNATLLGEPVDLSRLHSKRKEKVEEEEANAAFVENDVESIRRYLTEAAMKDDFNDSIDNDRPRQFLSNNLAELVLVNASLSEFIAVYVIPIKELRRTRVQFYWCLRESRIPYCPVVARWMLKNYANRHGIPEECGEKLLSARPTQPDLFQFASFTSQTPTNPPASNEQIAAVWESLRADLGQIHDESTTININLAAVVNWVGETLEELQQTEAPKEFSTGSVYSRSVVTIEAIRIAADGANSASLSSAAFSNDGEKQFHQAFQDDALTIDKDYLDHCKKYNIQCSNSDVFNVERQLPQHSTNEIYSFTFFIEDLRRYCAKEKITVPTAVEKVVDTSFESIGAKNGKKNMLFWCVFNNNDIDILDTEIQKSLERSGFIVTPKSTDNAHGSGLEYCFAQRHIDGKYFISLETQCRKPAFQLHLATLLNLVARLEVLRVEPYEIEPPVFDTVAKLQQSILDDSNVPLSMSVKNCEIRADHVALTHQQTCLFRWIRDREDACIAVKDRNMLSGIAVANTGWNYDCRTAELRWTKRFITASKRKTDEADTTSTQKKRKLSKNKTVETEIISERGLDNIAGFIRNQDGVVDDELFCSVAKLRRTFIQKQDTFNVLFVSGGVCTGKRTTVIAVVLYELSASWNCVVECDKEITDILESAKELQKTHEYSTRKNAREAKLQEHTNCKLRNKYFDQTVFGRGQLYGDPIQNIQLSRVSLLHAIHVQWKLYLKGEIFKLEQAEEGQILVDNSALLARAALDRIIAKRNFDDAVTVEEMFTEMWYSFQLLRKHHQLFQKSDHWTQDELDEAIEKDVREAHKRLEMINKNEPPSLQHCKIFARSTLILCPEEEIDHWLQAAHQFGDTEYKIDSPDGNDCWWFVSSDKDCGPVDAAIYVIRDIVEWQSLTWSRLLLADIVIIAYECIGTVNISDALYMKPFTRSISNVKKAMYCDSVWMRCLRQHMSIIESTPLLNLLKTHSEIAMLSESEQNEYARLEQVPLEAIRWQRVVFANYESYLDRLAISSRTKRCTRAQRLTKFIENVRCVRRVFVSSKTHSVQTLNDYFLPILSSNTVVTLMSEPMTPSSLDAYRKRWRHTYGDLITRQHVSHAHPQMLLCYSRQCLSMSVTPRHKIKSHLLAKAGAGVLEKSNRFILRDIERIVRLDKEQTNSLQNITILLNLVQLSQALYRADSSPNYLSNQSSAAFFTMVCQQNTLDTFKGGLGSRSPADLMLNFQLNPTNCNSAVESSLTNIVPTHIFRLQNQKDQTRDAIRFVRIMDRYDPAAWRDFRMSRQIYESQIDSSHLQTHTLKPTYRYVLHCATHAPYLIPIVEQQLSELLMFRDARLLSSVVRSSTETPEFMFTSGISNDILHRSMTQSIVAESFVPLNGQSTNVQTNVQANVQAANVQTNVQANVQAAAPTNPQPQTVESTEQNPSQNVEENNLSLLNENNLPLLNENNLPLLNENNLPLLTTWRNRVRFMLNAPVTYNNVSLPDMQCFEQRSYARPQNHQDRVYNGEINAFHNFLSWRLSTIFSDEQQVQFSLLTATRPDITTAVATCAQLGAVRVPTNRIEILSNKASNDTGYRHCLLSMADRCLFAICDTITYPNIQTLHKTADYNRLNDIDISEKTAVENSKRSLNDTAFYRESGFRLVSADEQMKSETTPLQLQRLLRRGIGQDTKKLRKEFYDAFATQYSRYVRQTTGLETVDAYLERLFETDTLNFPSGRYSRDNFSNDEASYDEEIEETISVNTVMSNNSFNDDDDDFAIFAEELIATQTRNADEGIVMRPVRNPTTAPTQPRPIRSPRTPPPPPPPKRTEIVEKNPVIADAVLQQSMQLSCVLHRYIVTEQNLLFEQRCADWMIIQMVRELDKFIATFNSHPFMRRVPLLCRLAEQCGPMKETTEKHKTNSQQLFSQTHRFYSENELLQSVDEIPYLSLKSTPLHILAQQHLEHHSRTLIPLIEMLTYNGHVLGPTRNITSAELQKLFVENETSEKEKQELLVQIVGGVKTSAPTYLVNMITKFCYETRWIANDLTFIRHQRQRALEVIPALTRLRNLLDELKQGKNKSDSFECPLCMESLTEAESIALYPCGHMCCFGCHSGCNKTMFRPRADDAFIGIATAGVQCFFCRYLLQFHERVIKTTFTDAVQRIVSNEATKEAAASEDLSEFIGPQAVPSLRAQEVPSLTADEELIDLDDNDDHLNPNLSLEDLTNSELLNVQHYFDYDTPSGSSSSDDEDDDGNGVKLHHKQSKEEQQKEEPKDEFTKVKEVVDAIKSRLAVIAALAHYDCTPKKFVVVSSMTQCLRNTRIMLKNAVRNLPGYDRLMVEFECLPESFLDQIQNDDWIVQEAYHKAMTPVIIYMFHLDLHENLVDGAFLNCIRPMSDVDSVFLIETPMVRLVDDRASHLLSIDIEQRILAKFCNEFSLYRGETQVFRFVLDSCSNAEKTVDRTWYDDTRWYK